MSAGTFVVGLPQQKPALVVGGHYTLPSGSVVQLDAILRGGQAGCHYLRRSNGASVTQADEVSFDTGWLQRYGQLNWGG